MEKHGLIEETQRKTKEINYNTVYQTYKKFIYDNTGHAELTVKD